MKPITRYIIGAIALLAIGWLLWYFSEIVAYVIIAWVLSLVGAPLMSLFTGLRVGRIRLGRFPAAALTIVCFACAIALLIATFVPMLVTQASNLAGVDYLAVYNSLQEPLDNTSYWLSKYGLIDATTADGLSQQLLREITAFLSPNRIALLATDVLSLAGDAIIGIFAVTFILFFFLKEENLFQNMLLAAVPDNYEKKMRRAIDDTRTLLSRYFGGVLLQITIITFLVSVPLSLMGVKNALLIGLFCGIINLIPYLGPVIGMGVGLLIAVSGNLDMDFYSQMLPMLLKLACVFIIVQLIDNFILQPYIFGSSVRAHPLEIFLVILMASQIGGIVGMILAIPTYTVMRVVLRAFFAELKIVKQLTARMTSKQVKKKKKSSKKKKQKQLAEQQAAEDNLLQKKKINPL